MQRRERRRGVKARERRYRWQKVLEEVKRGKIVRQIVRRVLYVSPADPVLRKLCRIEPVGSRGRVYLAVAPRRRSG